MSCFLEMYTSSLQYALDQLDAESIELYAKELLELRARQGSLYICGNGGSAANANHLANDFSFGINPNGKALSVESLVANSSVLTCLANDIGYQNIFSRQLVNKARAGDILLILSGSGNSENVVNAAKQAQKLGMKTSAILGYDGGKLKSLVDICFHVSINDMQVSEDIQLIIGHMLMKLLNRELSL